MPKGVPKQDGSGRDGGIGDDGRGVGNTGRGGCNPPIGDRKGQNRPVKKK